MTIIAAAILLPLLVLEGVIGAPHARSQEGQANTQAQELAEADKLTQTVVTLYSAGKHEEAVQQAERVVKIRQRWLAKDDERLLSAIFNLGVIQLTRSKNSEAKTHLERVLKAYEQIFAAESPKLGAVLDQLGIAYYRLNDTGNAERTFLRALTIREKALDPNHPDIARSLRSLADFYQFEARHEKAEPVFQRLIEIQKRQGTPEALAESLQKYACVFRKTNRAKDAEKIESEALTLTKRGTKSGIQTDEVVNGRALHLAQPPFPAEARAARASGKVRVRVLIDENGKVIMACAIEGPRQLMQASETAAYRSTFSPRVVDGAPVSVSAILIYNFVIQ